MSNPDQMIFFINHPDPMWIYDPETLRFLDINKAALEKYGYSRKEFLDMTIADIRPARLASSLDATEKTLACWLEAGVFQHKLKSGEIIYVDVTSNDIEYHGRTARVICARDVTRFAELEREQETLLQREREIRVEAETAAQHFRSLFEATPGKYLVLSPESYEIIAVSDAYLNATMTRREDIKGKRLFEVFPDDPGDRNADGARNLKASLERVAETGLADVMGVQRYPIKRPKEEGGGFEERYWTPVNIPLKDFNGKIVNIIHRVEDVTDFVRFADDNTVALQEIEERKTHLALDILLRARELEAVNSRLEEQEANLRMAQRLLGLGIWRLDIHSGALYWSDNVYDMFGVNSQNLAPDLDTYIGLVHSDDRDAFLLSWESFLSSSEDHFHFEHRIVQPRGHIIHVRGVGERTLGEQGQIITGVVQDVSEQKEQIQALSRTSRLINIAGRVARVGGWRIDLQSMTVELSPVTAEIHGLRDVESISLDEAIEFYAPEYRSQIREIFANCAEHGAPYDEVLQLISADNRRLWVRAAGEAEYDAEGNIVAVHGAFQDISEYVEARDQSLVLSQRLMETLENISDAFFTLDSEWRFTFINSQAEKVLGCRKDELLGNVIWDEFPGAVGTVFQRGYENAVATGETFCAKEFYAPLGKWLEVNAYPYEDSLAVYFRDITAEHSREEQLLLLETAVSRQNDILLITEAQTLDEPHGPRIVYVNDAFVRRTGYDREEALGKTPRLLQGAGTQRDELDRIRRALEKKEPVRAELINYTRTGQEFWVELDVAPILTDDGDVSYWVSIQRDITERKCAEEKARISEERFGIIAKATNDVIWDWDLVHETIWWNEGFRVLFGYGPEDVEPGPESWYNRIHPEDRERVVNGIHAVIDSDATFWADEYRFLCADGDAVTVIDRGFVIRDEQGGAVRMLGSMIDVTERRELEERLQQAQKMEAVGQLTGGIAHDFNNLLTVILGNTELLGEELQDHRLRGLAEMAVKAAERGAELTNRLLAISRRQALQPSAVDINELVENMRGLLERALGEDIDIDFIQAPDLWPAEVDPGQLETAILNLAINARDAMPEGGYLTLETNNAFLDEDYAEVHQEVMPGNYVKISVSDSGTGMPPDTLTRAFEPFFTTKEVGKGSGLGLSMIYGFVKQSFGHIKIYSEVGEGTTVKLYLPLANANSEGKHDFHTKPDTTGGSEHILVVEDNALVREHLISQLKLLGYRVTGADNGHKALDLIQQEKHFDLLFTDVVMPGGINGRELANAARTIKPGLRILFTSGYTENAIVHNGRLDPDVHLLSKPYHLKELAAKVRLVLEEPLVE